MREQLTDNASQMVVASWTFPWAREEKAIHNCWCYHVKTGDSFFQQMGVEEHKRSFFGGIAPSQGTLVSDKPFNFWTEEALEAFFTTHNTSSPSPRATSRSRSVAIFPYI